MLRKLGIGFIALATMAPGLAAALGVGEYELNSYLNEPLDMTVELHDLGGLSKDEILANLATQEAFDAAGVDRGYFLSDLKFDVAVNGGNGVLHIRSKQPVREPYLNFLVEFLWPTGRLMREYTILLDPPSYADGDSLSPAVSKPSPRPADQPQASADTTPAQPPARPSTRPAPADSDVADRDTSSAGPRAGAASSDGDATYRVRASDTMWRIARRQRPSSDVSVQQMMLAIQDNNPDAFIDDNVNLVREGAVLRIPSEDQVRRLSSREALSRVASQNREWRSMRPESVAGQPQRAPLDATGRDGDDQVTGGGDGQGQVTLVTPDSREGVQDGDATGGRSGDADTAALQNELAIRDENLDRLNRENSELRSRLDDLDEQVSTSQRLLEMRSEKIAALQAELRRLGEEQDLDVDSSLLEENQPVDTAEPEAGSDDQAADDDQTASTGQSAEDDVSALGAPGPASGNGGDAGQQPPPDRGGDGPPSVTPPDKPEPATLDQTSSETTPEPAAADGGVLALIRDNLLYVGAALAVLLLLLLLALRRRQNDAADDQDGDEYDDGHIGDDFEAPVIAGAEHEDDNADLQEDLDDDQMDPMERADVYVAYGQYPQAVDFLRNEINQAPERGDLKIRLLELLRESNDERGFDQQATQFAGTSPAVDAAIKRLGGDPGEHDYGDSQYAAGASQSGDHGDELSLDDMELDLASDLSDQPDQDSDSRSGAALAGAAAGFAAADDQRASDDLHGEASYQQGEASDQNGDELELDDFDFSLDDEEPENRNLRDETPLELDDLVIDDGEPGALSEDDNSLAFSLDDDLDSDPDNDADTTFTDEELAALEGGTTETPHAARDEAGDDELEGFEELELEDLDLSASDQPTGVESGTEPEPQSGLDDELADLSLADNDEPDGATAESDEPELSLDDLDLDDEGDKADDVADRGGDDSPAALDTGSDDLDDLDLELDDAGDQDLTASVPPATASEVSDDMLGDDDDFDFLGETDENATKLDLARAYIDMGDAEGARDILNEVLSEGSDEQQGEAKELLARVS